MLSELQHPGVILFIRASCGRNGWSTANLYAVYRPVSLAGTRKSGPAVHGIHHRDSQLDP
jgi:hypothetical protein